MTLAELRDKRARVLREAEALQTRNGQFATDQARADFDAKMLEIDGIDEEIRALDPSSEFIVERNPLDPNAPNPPQRRAPEAPTQPNDRDRGADQERERVQGILLAVRAARLPQSVSDKLIADKTALVDAQRQVFEELGRREIQDGPRPGPQNVRIGDDPLVHVRAGIENAILHRVAPEHFKLEDAGRAYRGMTLLDVARTYLQAKNIRTTGFSKLELAGAALGISTRGGYHTTSDFAILLENVVSKTLRRAYEESPQTFKLIARQTTLPDFKPVRRVQIGEAPALLEVKEHGEFTRGTIGEGRETFQLATYGRVFAITRQAIVNDDTDAFSRVPQLFGRSARNLESNLVWAQITSNPLMGDGNALFSTAHGNLAADGDPISIITLGDGRTALRNQKGLDATTLLNISAKYILVPASLETVADQFVSTTLLANITGQINPFAGRLQVIAEPRLDAVSTLAWYLAASPDQIDMVEYAYLEGESGPTVETRVGFDIDGLEIKARHDFAAKVIDWRGFYKNVGDEVS